MIKKEIIKTLVKNGTYIIFNKMKINDNLMIDMSNNMKVMKAQSGSLQEAVDQFKTTNAY